MKVIPLSKLSDAELADVLRRGEQARRKIRPSRIDRMTRDELLARLDWLAPKPRQKKPRMPKNLGVGRFCRELLTRVVGQAPDGPIGMSYKAMVRAAQRKFPLSAVDERHMRWYAAQMRRDGIMIPFNRERSKWKK